MGRTVPTFSQQIQNVIEHWRKFRRVLRRKDQEHFDRMFRRTRDYVPAMMYQCHDNPLEAILISLGVENEKRLDSLERAMGQQVELHETLPMDFPSLPEPHDEIVDSEAD